MIQSGSRIKLTSGVVNPDNLGKLATVIGVFSDGEFCQATGRWMDYAVYDVLIDGGSRDGTLTDIESVFISDIEAV